MSKSLYNYVRDQWKSPSGDVKNLHKTRLVQYRPAERDREVTDEVVEADYSIVFDQAENR